MSSVDLRTVYPTDLRHRYAHIRVLDPFTEFGIIALLEETGIEVVSALHEDVFLVTDDARHIGPRTVLIVDDNGTAMRALEALFSGNLGAIVSRHEPEQLAIVIESLVRGLSSFPRPLAMAALKRPQIVERQRRILELIAAGLSNATIAKRLYLSEATIKRDITALLRLFDCRSRAELVDAASRMGFSTKH